MDTDITSQCFAVEENMCTDDQGPTGEFIKTSGKFSEGGGDIAFKLHDKGSGN